jgi:hypothetical protein
MHANRLGHAIDCLMSRTAGRVPSRRLFLSRIHRDKSINLPGSMKPKRGSQMREIERQ